MVAIEASSGPRATVHQAEEEMLKANRAVGDAVGRFLETHLVFRKRVDLQGRFREMDTFLDQVMNPGQCIHFNEAGKDVISSCLGFYSQDLP